MISDHRSISPRLTLTSASVSFLQNAAVQRILLSQLLPRYVFFSSLPHRNEAILITGQSDGTVQAVESNSGTKLGINSLELIMKQAHHHVLTTSPNFPRPCSWAIIDRCYHGVSKHGGARRRPWFSPMLWLAGVVSHVQQFGAQIRHDVSRFQDFTRNVPLGVPDYQLKDHIT